MAFPVGVRTKPKVSDYAVRLRVYPTTDGFASVELQRSSSGSTFVRLTVFEPQAGTLSWAYTDYLPSDGGTRNYRCRAVADGYTPGGWSATVSATPSSVNPTEPQVPLESNTELPTFFVGSTANIRVGPPSGTGTRTRTHRFGAHNAIPNSSTAAWIADDVYVYPNSTRTVTFRAPVFLAQNAVITAVRVRGYRGTTAASVAAIFERIAGDGVTTLVSLAHATTGWATLASSVMSETVTTARHYAFQVSLNATPGNGARWEYAEVTYTVSNYETAF